MTAEAKQTIPGTSNQGRTCRLHDGADTQAREDTAQEEQARVIANAPSAQRRLGEVVRRQLDGRAHRGTKHGGIDAASEALDAFFPDNVDQAV